MYLCHRPCVTLPLLSFTATLSTYMDEEVWPYRKYDDDWGRDITTLPPGLQSLRASMFFNKCMDAVTLPSGLLYLTFRRALQPKASTA